MKKFHITASYTTYFFATVKAETQEQAYDIACDMNGGDFVTHRDAGLTDWSINQVQEIEASST